MTPGAKKKSYAYTDPNEDAVAVVLGETTTLVVLADGHNGMASARAAVACVTQGVRLAVNYSGDSGSTGAMTGNILGAMYGYDGIPAHWVRALDVHAAIETLCRDWNTVLASGSPPDVDEDRVWLGRYPPW